MTPDQMAALQLHAADVQARAAVSQAWAAWVQAIGAITAIVASVALARGSAARERAVNAAAAHRTAEVERHADERIRASELRAQSANKQRYNTHIDTYVSLVERVLHALPNDATTLDARDIGPALRSLSDACNQVHGLLAVEPPPEFGAESRLAIALLKSTVAPINNSTPAGDEHALKRFLNGRRAEFERARDGLERQRIALSADDF